MAKAPTSLLVAVVVPLMILVMVFIHRQYKASARHLAVRSDYVVPPPRREERVIVPIPGINRAVIQAVNVGRSIAPDVRAVLISDEPEEASQLRERWERQLPDVPLVIVESPYRALVGPMLSYLHVLDETWPEDKEAPVTFVVIPEYVARNWWERLLYNQSANRLRRALIGRPHTVVVNVPYRRDDDEDDDTRGAGCTSLVLSGVRFAGMPESGQIVPFRKAVLCLNGGPTDDLIVHLGCQLAKPGNGELVAVHVIEVDWRHELSEEMSTQNECGLGRARSGGGHRRALQDQDQRRSAPGARSRGGVGRRGDRAGCRRDHHRPALPDAVRR